MSARRKVLLFAPLCHPPAGSEAIATAKLVVAMLDAGWGVTVVAQSDFGQFYPSRGGTRLDAVRDVVVSLSGLTGSGGRVGTGAGEAAAKRNLRTAGWVARAVAHGRRALARGGYTHLLSRAAPQYGHLPAWVLRRSAGLPWIANWSDPMPPQRAPAPYGGGPSARPPRLAGALCDAITRSADWHTFPCERLLRYFTGLYPWIACKASVVPHLALPGLAPAAEAAPGFTLCHCGSVFMRDPGVFMEGVRLFLDRRGGDGLRLVFVTGQEREVREAAARHGVGGIVDVVVGAGYERSLEAAAAATALVVLESPMEEGIFFPSKLADYAQTGRPILAVSPAAGTLSDILRVHGGGLAADCRSPVAVGDAVGTLYDAWKDGSLDARFGSSHLMVPFGPAAVLSCLDGALERAAAR